MYEGKNINIDNIEHEGFIIYDKDYKEAVFIDNVQDAERLLQNLTCYIEHMGNTDEGDDENIKIMERKTTEE